MQPSWAAPEVEESTMNKGIGILAGLLIGQLALAVALHRSDDRFAAFEPRDKLLAFDQKAVDGLRIEAGTTSLVLRKRDGQWRLPDKGDFPADQGAVEGLLGRLASLEKGLAVATSIGAAKRFKVDEGAFERKLTVLANDQPQAVLFLGSSPGFRKVHARPHNEEAVYSVTFDTWETSPKADDWVNKAVLKLDEAEVMGIELPGLVLTRDGETLRVAGLNEGEETLTSEARALVSKVADLRIAAVLSGDAISPVDQEAHTFELKLTLKGGEVLSYRFSKPKEGGYYLLKRSDLAPSFKLAEYVVKPIAEITRERLVKPNAGAPAVKAGQESAAPGSPTEATDAKPN